MTDRPALTVHDQVIDGARGLALRGLAYSASPQVRQIVLDEYDRERKACIAAGKTVDVGAYFAQACDARTRLDIMEEVGRDGHARLFDGEGSCSNLYQQHIRKYLLFDAGPPVEIQY